MEKNKKTALENELLGKLNLDVLPSGGYLTSDKAITYLFEDKKDGFFWGKTSYFDNYIAIDFFDFIGTNKEVIIDFAIEHPEVSYDLLYWLAMTKICKPKDFKQYSKEQLHKIPRVMREVIVNPADKYKLHIAQVVTDETLYYSITDENKWTALEWVAVNYPEKLSTFVGKNTPANPLSRKLVLEHYKDIEDKTTLPEALQKFLVVLQKQHEAQVERQRLIAEKRKQQAKEKLTNWYEYDGSIMKLFTLEDGLEIKTLDDYKLILSYFIASELSATEFCRHYQIDNVEGFKLMCKKFGAMDPEFEAYYADLTARKQRELFAVASGEIMTGSESPYTIERLINNSSLRLTLPTIITLGDSIAEPQAVNNYARNVISYYHEKLNSYSPTSASEEDILKRLTEQEVRFLISSKTNQRFKECKNVDLGAEFVGAFKPISTYLGRTAKDQIHNPITGVKQKIAPYAEKFNPGYVLSSETQIITPDGSFKPVTQEAIDMATTYANKHKLYKSAGTVSRIIKAIVDGSIQNQEETKEYLTFIKKREEAKIEKCATLDGYMEYYAGLGN